MCLPFIRTKKLILEIPSFELVDDTKCIIRNVTAFEQLHYPHESHICRFIFLMDLLIDTDNAAIANMFNRLGLKIVNRNTLWCYSDIARALHNHTNNPWNQVKANVNLAKVTLKSVYFKDLWTGTATVTAILILLLTLIQTVCSVIQVL